MKSRVAIIVMLAAVAAAAAFYWYDRQPSALMLTGIVTTDDVRVSSQMQGRLQRLLVRQGDTVEKGQLLAVIDPREQKANTRYFRDSEREAAARVDQAKADLARITAQTRDRIVEAEATLAQDQAQADQARADLEYARLRYVRAKALEAADINSKEDFDQARTAYAAAKAHLAALSHGVEAARAALAQARAGDKQVQAQKAILSAGRHQQAAAASQAAKASVLLGYTRITAPISGIVDLRAALQGEVVTPGQAILTLIDPDNLWVRADVEESYIDRIHLGDRMQVRLPSGTTRTCTVFYRGVDADFATQRDVSRTKRDIKTFQIRLRCDNRDRGLALGMTAHVSLRLGGKP